MAKWDARIAGVLLLLSLPCPLAVGDSQVDRSRIYHGDPDDFEKPGVLSWNAVFGEIPAYRRILEEKIPTDDPRYWLLLEEANRIFRRSLAQTERDHDYDLVGELGSIVVDGEPAPEITAIVVEIVRALVRIGNADR